jgi:D-glycero-alpha-D-manno-heptose-7-phosphate kinase
VIGESFSRRIGYAVAETIVTRAPTRIDFGGGWTDVPPVSDEMGGYVCNVAIARYATVTVTRDGDSAPAGESADRSITEAAARRFRMRDAHIQVASDFPIGAGLGGSSAVGVATVAALASLRGERMMPAAVAELSREIEINDLGIAGGRQDHYAAAYGGALGLRFSAGRVDVREIHLAARVRAELERRCIVIYTGQSRISGDTITAVLDAYRAREPKVLAALRKMKELAEQMGDALAAGHVDHLGRLVGDHWLEQRSLHPAIPTPLIDEIIDRARRGGAAGAKALGASGGGCVLIVAGPANADAIRRSIADLGELLPFTVDETGVERCR